MLVLLISVTLILLKLSFLLLLIVGPFFLLIGTHPGFGRVVALRWVEMLIGVLLKQAAVALVLSLLLYCYALIMGTSDAVLPWALKILMIALVTVAAFIYRKPFQHLFSAVGYGVIGSQERAETDLARAGATARANTRAAATVAVPGFAAYRAGRWARRNPGQAAGLAVAAASGGSAAAVAAGVQAGEAGAGTEAGLAADGTAAPQAGGGSADGARTALAARARAAGGPAGAAAEPPPLNLPSRPGGPPQPALTQAAAAAASTASTGGTIGARPEDQPAFRRPRPERGRSAARRRFLRRFCASTTSHLRGSQFRRRRPGPATASLRPARQHGRCSRSAGRGRRPRGQRSRARPARGLPASVRRHRVRRPASGGTASGSIASGSIASGSTRARSPPLRPGHRRRRWAAASGRGGPTARRLRVRLLRRSHRPAVGCRQSSGRQAAPREPASRQSGARQSGARQSGPGSPLPASQARGRLPAASGPRRGSRRAAIRLRDGQIQAHSRLESTRAQDRISR